MLLLRSVLVLVAFVSAATAVTVVGVAGRRVRLPCRAQAAGQAGVEVCWGRGSPSLFNCHNAIITTVGNKVTYRKSLRYSVSLSSSSLSIRMARGYDSGFYHCRAQLPGLFNDQTATVYLDVIDPRYWHSPTMEGPLLTTAGANAETPNAPRATLQYDFTDESGDGPDVNTSGPVVVPVQSSFNQQQINSLLGFIGNTVRASFIIFIPALLLTAAYRFCWTSARAKTDSGSKQTEEESRV